MKINKPLSLHVQYQNKSFHVQCTIHIRALKQAINHGLKLKKVHKVIEFEQEA